MHPVLFTVAGLEVPTLGSFVALGCAVGLGALLVEASRRHAWGERLLPVIAGIVVGGALGGRIASMLDAAASDGVGGLTWAWLYGGRSILGGLTGAYLGALVGKKTGGYSGRAGSLFAPAVAIALAVGWIGRFLTEAPGRPHVATGGAGGGAGGSGRGSAALATMTIGRRPDGAGQGRP